MVIVGSENLIFFKGGISKQNDIISIIDKTLFNASLTVEKLSFIVIRDAEIESVPSMVFNTIAIILNFNFLFLFIIYSNYLSD